MGPRKKLTDILRQSDDRERLKRAWDATAAAGDLKPLPAGEYVCRIIGCELFNAKTGTAGVKLTFEIADGEHEGRHCWHDNWLTAQALPVTKRDLLKLGITTLDLLDDPETPGKVRRLLCKVKVGLRKDDDGNEFNRVRSFEVLGDEPGDAFEPTADTGTEADGKPEMFNGEPTKSAGPYRERM